MTGHTILEPKNQILKLLSVKKKVQYSKAAKPINVNELLFLNLTKTRKRLK